MSLTNNYAPCATNILDFRTLPMQQTAIESCQVVEYPSYTALPRDDQTPLEFRIDGTDEYVDLNRTGLFLKVQLLNSKGEKLKPETLVAPINNIGQTMFSSVDIYINDQKLTQTDGFYPWVSYIYNLLYTPKNLKNTILGGNAWFADDAGAFDTMDEEGITNSGFDLRRALFADSKVVTLHSSLLSTTSFDRLIPPHTDLTLKFSRESTSLVLVSKTGEYILRVLEAKLLVTKVRLTEAVSAQYSAMLRSSGYLYPCTNIQTRAKTVSKGDQNVDWVPFQGKLPSRIYIWQTSQKAYNGIIDLNPLNFKTFGISRLQVFKNGISLPLSQGFSDMSNGKYMVPYLQSLQGIGSPSTVDITFFQFRHGYFIMVIDLTDDASNSGDYINPSNTGSLRICIDYQNALEEPVTLFCMAEMSGVFKLEESKNIEWIN